MAESGCGSMVANIRGSKGRQPCMQHPLSRTCCLLGLLRFTEAFLVVNLFHELLRAPTAWGNRLMSVWHPLGVGHTVPNTVQRAHIKCKRNQLAPPRPAKTPGATRFSYPL